MPNLREWLRPRQVYGLRSVRLPVLRADGRWANRTLVIDATGEIAARYDKIHMFDVQLDTGESWRELRTYAPGDDSGGVPRIRRLAGWA